MLQRVWQGKTDDVMGLRCETKQGSMDNEKLCSSVRVILENILKWASCRLYKKFQGCAN